MKRGLNLILILIGAIVLTTALTSFLLYSTSLNEERSHLQDIARSQINLIDSVAQHDEKNTDSNAQAATLSQIKHAYENYETFSHSSGEFTLAKYENEHIVFLLRQKQNNFVIPDPIPINSGLAEPMHRALGGQSGTMIGKDYEGRIVLAAYEPIKSLNYGIVAKIELRQIQQPYFRTVLLTSALALGILLLSSLFFIRQGQPILDKLNENELLFQSAFEQNVLGMLHLTPKGKIQLVNPRFCQLSGRSAEELHNTLINQLLQIIEPEQKNWLDQIVSEQKQTIVFEAICQQKNGEHRWCNLSLSAIRDEKNELKFINVAIEDISESKHLQEEQHKLLRKLKDKNLELEQYNISFSHDLQNPLTTLQLFTGYLLKDIANGEQENILDDAKEIDQAAHIMNQKLNAMLVFSKTGISSPGSRDWYSLEAITREAAATLKEFNPYLKAEFEIASDLPKVKGNKEDLQLLMHCLLDNAAKFMGEQSSPKVQVGCQNENDQKIIFVEDNGIGVPGIYQQRVYKLFEQLEPSKHGVGIGLAIVKKIIDSHEGQIWIESDGKNGSVFKFTLPE